MELITQRQLIEGVSKRWRDQYSNGWSDKNEIGLKLEALDLKTATAAEVDAAIGNSSWTKLDCDECRKAVLEVVQVGQTPDYESSTAFLCLGCLSEAHNLIANRSLNPKRKLKED